MSQTPSAPSPRERKWQLDHLESCIASLLLARSLHTAAKLDTTQLDALIQRHHAKRDSLGASLGQAYLEPRHRAKLPKIPKEARPTYLLFLDECGGHDRPSGNAFKAFCLCCLIVEQNIYDELLVPRWEGLKARFLQREEDGVPKGKSSITHEPSLRPTGLSYRLRHIPNGPQAFERELASLVSEVAFTIIASVVSTSDFYALYGSSPVDTFLPSSVYSMCLDFVMERATHFLSADNKGAYGRVVAESRERREDALLQYEYVRLQLEGTQYVSPSWFRQQLAPAIDFRTKVDNVAGLQLTDLFARPIAEQVVGTQQTINRWDVLKNKLWDGGQGRKESYGLKVFPSPVTAEFFQ